MKLHRPYIPLRVRVQVAERQFFEDRGYAPPTSVWRKSRTECLQMILHALFGNQKIELHHRPALCNRVHLVDGGIERYHPDANDPDYLVYLPADEHDIETRVRGQHGDYSDLAKARKSKRIAKKRDPKRRKYKWPKRSFVKRVKDKP